MKNLTRREFQMMLASGALGAALAKTDSAVAQTNANSRPTTKGQRLGDFKPFVFAVIADPQIGMVENARDRHNFAQVVKAVNNLTQDVRPDFALIAGDLIQTPEDSAQLSLFDEVNKSFAMPVHTIPGNHDIPDKQRMVDQAAVARYRKTRGSDRFTIEHGDSLFIGYNSQLWLGGGAYADEQFKWLDAQLHNRNRYAYVFVMQHHPLYLTAAGETDQYFNTPLVWRTRLLPLFEQRRVTAVLSGHWHRNLSGNYRGIEMLTTPSPCKNFDGSAYGYRLVSVTSDGFTERYVGVPGTLPENKPS
ncbi:MAG: metallophosphoesterase [Pyrinomonadaceae bacterium]|nr:metallophosphoesterase [Pyrinomonadaceae bacterium]